MMSEVVQSRARLAMATTSSIRYQTRLEGRCCVDGCAEAVERSVFSIRSDRVGEFVECSYET